MLRPRRRPRPPGLVIAYMQARVPPGRARPIIERQRRVIEDFVSALGIPVDLWYWRAKGVQPLPTPEQLIREGRVYCLIAERWSKLLGCKSHWPDLHEIAAEHRVRRVLIAECGDIPCYGEPNLFQFGWRLPGPRPVEPYLALRWWMRQGP